MLLCLNYCFFFKEEIIMKILKPTPNNTSDYHTILFNDTFVTIMCIIGQSQSRTVYDDAKGGAMTILKIINAFTTLD